MRRFGRFGGLLVMWLVAFAATPAPAQEFFAAARDFVIDRACDATTSIRGRASPSPLDVGKSYPGRGLNRAVDPTHVFIRVGDQSKWVALDCGHFADGGAGVAAAGHGKANPRGQGACEAFFDTFDNPVQVGFGGRVDITPPPPALDAFDRALVQACGAPGKVVGEAEFKALMKAHPQVLSRLRAFTRGTVFADRPERTTDDAFLADLTEAWFTIKAFDHIFCGEPSAVGGGKIGGLHFHGRYLQLQEEGLACRMNNLRQNEVVPGVIYTLGVIMRVGAGREVRDAIKGYGLTLGAEDLLKVVTRAFAENATSSTDSAGCLLSVTDDGRQFSAVFVRRAAGIRTFYPDATPNGRGDRINPPCAKAIALQ